MTEFADQDFTGARFERVRSTDATFRNVSFRGVQVHGAAFDGARLHGVEMVNVDISGELVNVVVNGVDIGPLVEAELNRRDPERAMMRPEDPAGFAEAWAIVRRRWEETVAHARTLPPQALHERVDGEWSFIETLRHLGFASAAWVGRMILGNPSPWHPLDLPWDEAPGWPGIPRDREVQPDLDTVLAVRAERQATVGDVIAGLTDEQLASNVSNMAPGWPQIESFPLRECLLVVLNEEWEHRNFAERDLAVLAAAAGG